MARNTGPKITCKTNPPQLWAKPRAAASSGLSPKPATLDPTIDWNSAE